MANDQNAGYGTGRRKTAVARVRLQAGEGRITINEKPALQYLGRRTLREAQDLDPTFPIYNAVKGMLQRNTLGADMLKRLRVYAGPEHEHAAQQPKAIKFNQAGDIDLG